MKSLEAIDEALVAALNEMKLTESRLILPHLHNKRFPPVLVDSIRIPGGFVIDGTKNDNFFKHAKIEVFPLMPRQGIFANFDKGVRDAQEWVAKDQAQYGEGQMVVSRGEGGGWEFGFLLTADLQRPDAVVDPSILMTEASQANQQGNIELGDIKIRAYMIMSGDLDLH